MKAMKERRELGALEVFNINCKYFGTVKGPEMSEQPRCTKCGKNYYKNHPEAKDGCKCKPKDKMIIVEAS